MLALPESRFSCANLTALSRQVSKRDGLCSFCSVDALLPGAPKLCESTSRLRRASPYQRPSRSQFGKARLRRAECATEHRLLSELYGSTSRKPSLCAKQAFLPVSREHRDSRLKARWAHRQACLFAASAQFDSALIERRYSYDLRIRPRISGPSAPRTECPSVIPKML
jgi:hypothetical protein